MLPAPGCCDCTSGRLLLWGGGGQSVKKNLGEGVSTEKKKGDGREEGLTPGPA